MNKKQKNMLIRILVSAAFLVSIQLIPEGLFLAADERLFSGAGRWLRFLLYLADYIIIGHDILRRAVKGIRNGQVFDENFTWLLPLPELLPWQYMKTGNIQRPLPSCCFTR